jgi:hypothetical protein
MTNQIKDFRNFIALLEGKDFTNIPEDPIIYKGYYIIVWPWRNDERHPDKRWGYTVSDNPEGENYLAKTKGPAGNYEGASKEAETIIDNLVQKSIQ